MNDKWLLTQDNKKFISWFDKRIYNDDSPSETIKWLSYLLEFTEITWMTYNISNFSFYTKAKDDHSTMQYSGLWLRPNSRVI